jgi:glycosyltransferase involved in cell wall biosynthesis
VCTRIVPRVPETLSVVVPARDAAATIGAALDALAAQRGAPAFEVVVVDNGSVDGTARLAETHPVGARVLRRARGEGPGAARNDGVAAATGAVIAFTDADCEPAPDWLAAGLAALETSGAGFACGPIRPRPGPRGPFDRTLEVGVETGLYETANLFARREWIERAGGFADTIEAGAPFGEDAAMVWRARRAGARTVYAPAALVHHAVFPRDAAGFAAERERLRHFPALAREIPELRDAFFDRRLFLSRHTAAFDAALAGAVAAAAAGSPLPLLAALPYARRVRGRARQWPRHPAWRVAAVTVVADMVAAAALVRGSLEQRTPVL